MAKQKTNRLHPAVTDAYNALGYGDGLTASDYRLRNRIKNRLSKVRDRKTLERVAEALGVSLD